MAKNIRESNRSQTERGWKRCNRQNKLELKSSHDSEESKSNIQSHLLHIRLWWYIISVEQLIMWNEACFPQLQTKILIHSFYTLFRNRLRRLFMTLIIHKILLQQKPMKQKKQSLIIIFKIMLCKVMSLINLELNY